MSADLCLLCFLSFSQQMHESNRLTAHLPLVYTTLPDTHPVHDHVVRRCQGVGSVVVSPAAEANLTSGPPPPPVCAAPPPVVVSEVGDQDDSTHCVVELWRLFLRRFPVLSVYRPVWSDQIAAETIMVPLDHQSGCPCVGIPDSQPQQFLAFPSSKNEIKRLKKRRDILSV